MPVRFPMHSHVDGTVKVIQIFSCKLIMHITPSNTINKLIKSYYIIRDILSRECSKNFHIDYIVDFIDFILDLSTWYYYLKPGKEHVNLRDMGNWNRYMKEYKFKWLFILDCRECYSNTRIVIWLWRGNKLMHVTCASVVSYKFSCNKSSNTNFLPLLCGGKTVLKFTLLKGFRVNLNCEFLRRIRLSLDCKANIIPLGLMLLFNLKSTLVFITYDTIPCDRAFCVPAPQPTSYPLPTPCTPLHIENEMLGNAWWRHTVKLECWRRYFITLGWGLEPLLSVIS